MGHHDTPDDGVPVVPLYYCGVMACIFLAICLIRAWVMRVSDRIEIREEGEDTADERSQNEIEVKEEGDGDGAERCPICLDPLRGEIAMLRACRHRYHRACVERWWATETRARHMPTCPLCRRITTNSVRHGQMQQLK